MHIRHEYILNGHVHEYQDRICAKILLTTKHSQTREVGYPRFTSSRHRNNIIICHVGQLMSADVNLRFTCRGRTKS